MSVLENMCSIVVDKANNAREEVANKPLTLTKYRAKSASSSTTSSTPCATKGSGGKTKGSAATDGVVLVEDDGPQAQLEVQMCFKPSTPYTFRVFLFSSVFRCRVRPVFGVLLPTSPADALG